MPPASRLGRCLRALPVLLLLLLLHVLLLLLYCHYQQYLHFQQQNQLRALCQPPPQPLLRQQPLQWRLRGLAPFLLGLAALS
jgi:uncharacterized membrane protein affecting hemolysin expression